MGSSPRLPVLVHEHHLKVGLPLSHRPRKELPECLPVQQMTSARDPTSNPQRFDKLQLTRVQVAIQDKAATDKIVRGTELCGSDSLCRRSG